MGQLHAGALVFERKLEDTLKSELGGDVFDDLLTQIGADFGITKRKHTIKNPMAIRELIERARNQSKTSPTLEDIIDRIAALRPQLAAVGAGGDA